MSTYARGPKGKADRLFSLVVRARGACQWPGCTRMDLQCAHIVSRRYNNTRTDLRNAWALCSLHHLRLTHDPLEHVRFAFQTIGEELYEELRQTALAPGRWRDAEWKEECTRLAAILEDAA